MEAKWTDGEKGDIRISCSGLAKVYAVIVMQNILIVHASFVRRGRLFPDPSRPARHTRRLHVYAPRITNDRHARFVAAGDVIAHNGT